jgi:HAD superfamily hydrolase (TIGR01509 family)
VLRLVTFDLDGTLFANGPYIGRLLREWFLSHLAASGPLWLFRAVRAARAFQRARDRLRPQEPEPGLHDRQFQLAAELCGYEERFVREVVDELIYENSFEGTAAHVFPGVRETLASLKARKLKLGVLSDYPVKTKLRAMGLDDCGWDVLLSSEDVNALKPRPELFLSACRRFGVAPADALHVGDRLDCDVAGAHAAGMLTLLLTAAGTRSKPGPEPDFRAANYEQLRIIVETLLGPRK